MKSQSVKKPKSSQWLIIFSDLFFILVAFFVFRHELIELPRLSAVHGKVKSGTELPPVRKSIFQEHHNTRAETLDIPVQKNWFFDEKEISSKGELEIKSLANILQSTDAKLSLILYVQSEDTPGSIQDKILLLTKSAKSAGLKLSTISILSTQYKISEENIAEFKLVFD